MTDDSAKPSRIPSSTFEFASAEAFNPFKSEQLSIGAEDSHKAERKMSKSPSARSPTSPPSASDSGEEHVLHYIIVDVFTREKLRGNPLAVVFESADSRPISSTEKQSIAKEFNLSETVFIGAQAQGHPENKLQKLWSLTIMTPSEELPFAGHPVIGAACALSMSKGMVFSGAFRTKAGNIDFAVERSISSKTLALSRAEVSVPFKVHHHKSRVSLSDIGQEQLGLHDDQLYVYDRHFPVFSITKGMTYILVEISSMSALSQVVASRKKLDVDLDEHWSPSFVGTYFYYRAPGFYENDPVELHTRMIEPEIGEDPVTGSAASALAAYLSIEAAKKLEIQRSFEYRITQGEHMGRKGTPTVLVKLDESKCVSSMTLKGDAVRVMRGTIER